MAQVISDLECPKFTVCVQKPSLPILFFSSPYVWMGWGKNIRPKKGAHHVESSEENAVLLSLESA